MNAIRFLLASHGSALVLNIVVAVTLTLSVTGLLAMLFRRRATNVYATCLGGLVAALLIPVAAAVCDWLSVRITVLSLESMNGNEIVTAESHGNAKRPPIDGVGRLIQELPKIDSQRSERKDLTDSNSARELTGLEFISTSKDSDANETARRRSAERIYRALAIAVVVAWSVGVLSKLTKAAHGVRVIAQTLKKGRRLPLNEFPALVQQVELAIKSSRMPAVLECSNVQVPMAVGVLCPTVLLPEHLAKQLSLPELRDVLVHECGHLSRKDNLTAWLQVFAEAIFWIHPLVYFVSQRLSRACEELCDNLVIQDGGRDRFAQLLLNLAKRGSPHPATALTIVDYRWKIEHRISALLDKRRSTVTHVGWTRGLAVMCAFIGLAVFAAASRVESTEPILLANSVQNNVLQHSEDAQPVNRATQNQLRVDSHGDRLPEGAIARLGSVRLHHDAGATAVALSPGSNKVLASASYFGDVRLWDVNTGKQLHLLQRFSGGVRALRFSPDGKQLVTGNDNGHVRLWDAYTGSLLHEMPPADGHKREPIVSIAFAPNGKRIAIGHFSGTVQILDVSSSPPQMTQMKGSQFKVFGGATVSFSPDGKYLASAENGRGCAIRIWNLEKDEAPVVIDKPHPREVVATKFMEGGNRLISAGVRQKLLKISGREYIDFDHELRTWDPRTGKMLGELQNLNQESGASLAFSADEKVFASAGSKGIVIWDMPSRRPVRTITQSFNSHSLDNAVDISQDGTTLVAALCRQTPVYMWKVATGERLHANLESHQSRVSVVAFDSEAKHVATVSDGIVRWWSLEGEKLLSTGIPEMRLDRGSHFSSDATIVVTLTKAQLDPETGVLEVWDVRAGQKMMEGTFSGEPGLATISDDKQLVAVATRGGQTGDPFGPPESKSIRTPYFAIWKIGTGTKVTEIAAPDLPVVALWFSEGGNALSCLDRSGNLRTTDIRSAGQVRSTKIDIQVSGIFPTELQRNALSANRKLFAYSIRSSGVHLVDLDQGKVRMVIPMPERYEHVLALSHDNQLLATAPAPESINASICLWHTESGKRLATLAVPDSPVVSMAFSKDGAWLVTGTSMGTALVWNVKEALEKAAP